ncbi:energy-coupling factor transporter transmembrane component T [Vagococcus humatus]|nr:energy-coupling factor transporter transmembrane component T [Vagococcus humatus]
MSTLWIMMNEQQKTSSKQDPFSKSHPFVNLFYFVCVIGVNMFLVHPIILGFSLIAASLYTARLHSWQSVFRQFFKFLLPSMMIVLFFNVLFNHNGETVLYRFSNGKPITLEAMVYGGLLSVVLAVTILWFRCYNQVMTSDKFIYLFGRILPASSLVISMVFRFVPKFSRQVTLVRQGQQALGRDVTDGTLKERLNHGFSIFLVMITWALENAIDTADSMKARGYGLSGRSSFSVYRLTRRDWWLLTILTSSFGYFMYTVVIGTFSMTYYPKVQLSVWPLTWTSATGMIAFFLLINLPVLLAYVEEAYFKRLRKQAKHHVRLPDYFKQ